MSLLIDVFRDPELAQGLTLTSWDVLIRQARHANLLGRLYRILQRAGKLSTTPEKPLNHLISGSTMADRQHVSIKLEAGLLHQTFKKRGIPLILLKGAAYVLANNPAAEGRVFADIDILVPEKKLAETESVLMQTGWVSTVLDAYDQRYYRRWMHELPPMQHIFRGTTLDVHHTILPPTSRLKPDASLLIEESVEIPRMHGIRTLCPTDIVLHSATHLFHEGEPDNLLRDLSDLDLLLRHFGQNAEFWNELLARAQRLQLDEPLRLALHYAFRIFGTPISQNLRKNCGAKRHSSIKQRIQNLIFERAFLPQHPSTEDGLSNVARKLLYMRSHWLRMPPHLLVYHLGHKFILPPKTAPVPLGDREAMR